MLFLILAILKYIFYLLIALTLIMKLIDFFSKKTCKCTKRLDGKVVLITGGNTGIGLEVARDMARRGARVVIASRDEKKSAAAVADIIKTTGNEKVEYYYLNLGSFESVRTFAEQFNKNFDRLDILVNNAGCAGLNHKITEDNINIVMQINYFGPFLLTNLLLDKLIASKPSRIIITSSLLHHISKLNVDDLRGHKKVHYFMVYANSKLCDILWAKALAKKVPEGVTVNAVHPGAVATDIYQRYYPIIRKIVVTFIEKIFKNSVEGAQTTIHLAVSDECGKHSGGYYSECAETWHSRKSKDESLIDEVWTKSLLITNSK